jgi:hypothetical protein
MRVTSFMGVTTGLATPYGTSPLLLKQVLESFTYTRV